MAFTKTTPTRKTTERPFEVQRASTSPGQYLPEAQIHIENAVTAPLTAPPALLSELRQQMIRDAAYFRAERRGFKDGDPVLDWLEAEAEIDQKLPMERLTSPSR